jgi:hypothetical protein
MGKEKNDFIDLEVLAKKLEERKVSGQPGSFTSGNTTQDVFTLIISAFKNYC